MSITLGDVILFLGADDSRLNGTLKGVEGKTTSWVNSLGGKVAMGLGAVITAAIGGATALGLAAFKSGETLDQAFDTLIIKTGASGDALARLQSDFRSVFASVPTSAQPAADVLAVLYQRTTLNSAASQELAKQLLESARIMGGDAATSAGLYTRMIGDWSIANEDASTTLDKVFVASQKTGIGIERLMELAVQFGAPMRLMGFSLEDSISLLAKWEKEGVNTELVMGSLRIAAGKFADEGKPLRESLLATFEAIKNNTDATAALSLGMDVFGARAGPDMVAAIREGRFEFEDMLTALQDTNGAILDTAQKTEDWGEKFTKFKNKATMALEPVGMKLLDVASMLLDKAAPAFEKLVPLLDKYVVPAVDRLATSLGYLVEGNIGGALEALFGPDVMAKVMPTLTAIGDWIMNVAIPFATEHAEEIKGALIGIGAALAAAGILSVIVGIASAVAGLASPIGLVLAVAGLLGAAWAGNWGGIQEKTAAVWAWLQPMLQQLGEWLQTNIPIAIAKLKDAWTNVLWPAIQTVWAWLKANIFPLFLQLAEWLGVNIPIAIQTLSDGWNGFMLAIQTVWAWLTTNIFPLFQQIADWLQINIPAALIYFSNLWTSIWTPILTTIQTVWAWLSMYLFPIFSALSDLIGTALNVALTVLAGIWQNVLLPAIQIVWAWISTNLLPVLSAVADVISSKWQSGLEAVSTLWTGVLLPAMKKVADWITTKLNPVIQPLSDWLKNVFVAALKEVEKAFIFIKQAIKGMTDALENIELPSWLMPGSPTPFEMGLRGIHDALSQINGASLPEFSAGLNLTGSQMPAMAAAGIGGGGSVTNIYIDGMQLPGIGLDTSIGEIVNRVMQFMNKGR